jgi:hypothetical protein
MPTAMNVMVVIDDGGDDDDDVMAMATDEILVVLVLKCQEKARCLDRQFRWVLIPL